MTTNLLWFLLVLTLQLQASHGVTVSPARSSSSSGSIGSSASSPRIQETWQRSQHQQHWQQHLLQQEQERPKHREMESGPPRRRIDPFTVTLSPIATNLTYNQANTVRNTAEELLQAYFETDYVWPDPQTSVTYVGLAQILSNVRTEDDTGAQITMNGLVYFAEESVNVPTETEILLIIEQQALTPSVLKDALLVYFPTLELAEVQVNLTATATTGPTQAPSPASSLGASVAPSLAIGTPTDTPVAVVATSPPLVTAAPSSPPVTTPTAPPVPSDTPSPVATATSSIVEDDTKPADSSGSSTGGLIGGIVAAIVVVMIVTVLWVRRKKAIGAIQPSRSKDVQGEDDEMVFEVDEEHGFDPKDWGWKPNSSLPSLGNDWVDPPAAGVAAAATNVTSPTISSASFSETYALAGSSNDSHMSNASPEKTNSTAETDGDRSTQSKSPRRKSVPPSDVTPPSPSGTSGTRSGSDKQTAAATAKAGTASAMSYWTSFFQRTPPSSTRELHSRTSNGQPDVMQEEINSVASSDLLRDDDDDEDFDSCTDFDDTISIQPHIVAINSLESFEHQRARSDFVVKKDMLESPIGRASTNPRLQFSALPPSTFAGLSSSSSGEKTRSSLIYTNADARDLAAQSDSSTPSSVLQSKISRKEMSGDPHDDDGASSDSDEDEKRQRAMMPNPYVHRGPYNSNGIMNLGAVDRSSSCALEPTDTSAASLAQRQGQTTQQQGSVNGSKSQNMIPKIAHAWWAHRSSSVEGKKKKASFASLDGSLNQSDDNTFDGGMDDDAWDPDSEMSSLGTAPTEDEMNTLFQTKVENKKEQSLMNNSLRNESQKRQMRRSSQLEGQSQHSGSDGEAANSPAMRNERVDDAASVGSEESDVFDLGSGGPVSPVS